MIVKTKRCINRAFTLIEVLLVIAGISAIGAVGYVATSNVKATAQAVKLESDVKSINQAIDLYRANGGQISADVDDVLNNLKTRADSATAGTMVGLKASFLDVRTEWDMQSASEAATSQLRAVWDPVAMAFSTSTGSTLGIKRFRINNELASAAPVTDPNPRTPTLQGAASGWVWDYAAASEAVVAVASTPAMGITGGALGAAVSQGFQSGYWMLGNGTIDVSYIFREAGYSSRLGLFSLEGMGPDRYDLTSAAGLLEFNKEAIRRVLNADGSGRGGTIIDASKSAVGFNAQYQFRPGDTVAAILIPNTSFEDSLVRLNAGTATAQTQPLLSLSYGDNSGGFSISQVASLGNNAFAVEDIRGGGDRDYNDLVFRAAGLIEPPGTVTRRIDPTTYFVNQPFWNTPNPRLNPPISIQDALRRAGIIP